MGCKYFKLRRHKHTSPTKVKKKKYPPKEGSDDDALCQPDGTTYVTALSTRLWSIYKKFPAQETLTSSERGSGSSLSTLSIDKELLASFTHIEDDEYPPPQPAITSSSENVTAPGIHPQSKTYLGATALLPSAPRLITSKLTSLSLTTRLRRPTPPLFSIASSKSRKVAKKRKEPIFRERVSHKQKLTTITDKQSRKFEKKILPERYRSLKASVPLQFYQQSHKDFLQIKSDVEKSINYPLHLKAFYRKSDEQYSKDSDNISRVEQYGKYTKQDGSFIVPLKVSYQNFPQLDISLEDRIPSGLAKRSDQNIYFYSFLLSRYNGLKMVAKLIHYPKLNRLANGCRGKFYRCNYKGNESLCVVIENIDNKPAQLIYAVKCLFEYNWLRDILILPDTSFSLNPIIRTLGREEYDDLAQKCKLMISSNRYILEKAMK